MSLPYNPNDAKSIESYAKLLLEKSLKDVLGNSIDNTRKGKGGFGEFVEKMYFLYEPNSISQPDFPKAGVELKTTPLKRIGKGLVSKERLVFNMIDYNEEYKYSFDQSSFWKKNSLLLLMFYLHDKSKLDVDYIFKIIRLWRFPAEDLKIMKDDWSKIVQKIKLGKAHEISESDTLYLGACTKGANSESKRTQPFSDILAMRRAFSLKQNYINFIIQKSFTEPEVLASEDGYESIFDNFIKRPVPETEYIKTSLQEVEPIVKDISQYDVGQTFEEYVISKFTPYFNLSENELISEFDIKVDNVAKNKFEVISRSILRIQKKKIEEFEKAGVIMKTIRIESNGSIKESMSFKQIQFQEIIHQTWEESDWFEELDRRFFFVIFKADNNGKYRLNKVMFWSLTQEDMSTLKEVWLDTKKKIELGDFDNFIKSSHGMIGHVRPKARDSYDLMQAPNGTMQKKKSFWLNSSFIRDIVSK